MRLVQVLHTSGARGVVAVVGDDARVMEGVVSVYALALEAIAHDVSLQAAVEARGLGESFDLDAGLAEGRVLSPIDHPDPAHLWLTGTGLTHLGSADARDSMHREAVSAEQMTDSMRMFRMGMDGGKPAPGVAGVQPEWFYKGDGDAVVAPGAPLPSPAFALDGGEEPEIAGVYVIALDGTPRRLGFALGNEFSDHVTERQNYLYLAHSKLRPASFGPELRLGALPNDVRGESRIRREGSVVWSRPFLSGEANMSHSLENLEHHHFKYAQFRRPGDVHVHFFGTATLSFADGFRAQAGDVFEVEAEGFGRPLRNALGSAPDETPRVRPL